MYTENNYLTEQILNNVEDKVVDLYDYYSSLTTEEYTPKEWLEDEYVFVDDIKHIEDSIDKIGAYFGYPSGYIQKRNWNLNGENNISYRDINRWLNNIELLRSGEYNPLLPSEILLPSEELKPMNKESD